MTEQPKEKCGECYLHPGETCGICGVRRLDITSPDRTKQYYIGERVGTHCDYPYTERVIAGYEDGSWDPAVHYDHSAWFVFEDGHRARPFVLIKLREQNGAEAFEPPTARLARSGS